MFNLVAPLDTTLMTTSAGPYVLLVDDNERCLELLHEVVTLSGYRCVTTCSPAEAIRNCERRRPQLVVTDLAMPNLDGEGLARRLLSRFPSVPIVLMTGQDLDAPTRAGLRRTFTEILAKPVDLEKFLALLDRLMPPRENH